MRYKLAVRAGLKSPESVLIETIAHILIVDDERAIRSLLAGYLHTNGYQALTAAGGIAMRKY